MPRTSIHYWLALKLVPRLSIEKKLKLVSDIGLTALFESTPALSCYHLTTAQRQAIISPDWSAITKVIENTQEAGALLIGYDEVTYPRQLKQIYDPPLVLFAKGNCALLNQPQLAIVGSRNCTMTAREVAHAFASELAVQGVVITSGLALGIDASAHLGANKHTNSTVAVIATGIDLVYPSRHKKLVNSILENGGLIISEFFPKVAAKQGHFPKRNRLISGMSLGVLVIEAQLKSGSLITARTALEQNREVFAIPGSIHNPMAQGCHELIKSGAKLVTCVADIMDEFEIPLNNKLAMDNRATKNECEKTDNQGLLKDRLLASVGDEITPIDVVVSRTQLPTEEVLSRLTILELRGLVTAVPGGYLKLNRG